MSGETEQNISGWTVDTLHSHLLRLVDDLDRRHTEALQAQAALFAARLDASDIAVRIEQENARQWRASANEWRTAMDDRERKFMPRIESEQRISDLIARVDKIESRVDNREGRTVGLGQGWGYIIGGIGAVVAIVSLILAFNS